MIRLTDEKAFATWAEYRKEWNKRDNTRMNKLFVFRLVHSAIYQLGLSPYEAARLYRVPPEVVFHFAQGCRAKTRLVEAGRPPLKTIYKTRVDDFHKALMHILRHSFVTEWEKIEAEAKKDADIAFIMIFFRSMFRAWKELPGLAPYTHLSLVAKSIVGNDAEQEEYQLLLRRLNEFAVAHLRYLRHNLRSVRKVNKNTFMVDGVPVYERKKEEE